MRPTSIQRGILLLLLIITCLVANAADGLGMLGKRFSLTVNAGIKPNFKFLYPGLYDPFSSSYLLNYYENDRLLRSTFNRSLQMAGCYVIGRNTELTFSLLTFKNQILVPEILDDYSLYIGTQLYNIDYEVSDYFITSRSVVTDLSIKQFISTSGEYAPSGTFIRFGVGITAINATPDEEEHYKGIKVTSKSQILTPTELSELKDYEMRTRNLKPFSAFPMHFSYGLGYQRFCGKRVYTSIGIDGSLPVGLVLNTYFDGIPSYWQYASKNIIQQSVTWSSFSANVIRFNFGMGYMLF